MQRSDTVADRKTFSAGSIFLNATAYALALPLLLCWMLTHWCEELLSIEACCNTQERSLRGDPLEANPLWTLKRDAVEEGGKREKEKKAMLETNRYKALGW